MAKLVVKGKDPVNYSYEQTDSFGTWRDMRNTGLRNNFIKEKKCVPKYLKEIKAQFCPENETEWLACENKNYKRVVHMDTQGFEFFTYTYMEAKKLPDPVWNKGTQKWVEGNKGEHFTYLLCTHLTLHLFCIVPNYWAYIWHWPPADEDELTDEEKKTHTGAWALYCHDWQENMLGILRPCFFCPKMTWGNVKKYLGNAGNKSDITDNHGYLHMNTYTVFLATRLKVGSSPEEAAKDRGEIIDQGMKDLFGKNLVPKFCSSTSKMTNGLQYSEGQHVTINAHNQVAQYPVKYDDIVNQKVMKLSHHEDGICWKILAIMWCDKGNKMANAGEPTGYRANVSRTAGRGRSFKRTACTLTSINVLPPMQVSLCSSCGRSTMSSLDG